MGARKEEIHLKKDLGILDIFCIASGAMISSGLFVLPAIAYSKAGPAIILSYAIASIMIIPAVLAKAELSTAMPKAGGTYFFIDRSMGPLMGTIGGFAAWFSLAFKSAFALIGIGIFTALISPILQNDLITKLIAVLFCVIFAIINIIGVKHTGKTQIVLVTGLLGLLAFYIITGLFYVNLANFENFAPYGAFSVFSTTGLIFVSYGGLTKVCSVAEECKKPGRTIPRGMFLAWGLITLLYLLVIFVTIGVSSPTQLVNAEGVITKTPISVGADNIPIFAGFGGIIMAIAAILAFISTANGGLLAASRDPMAMGKDQLLPKSFVKMSKKGTPIFSIIFTTIFMVIVILFLDLESLIKTASTLKILLFLLITIALIIMRESKIRNYRPKFKSPFYPWIQMAGIVGFIFLIIQMGWMPVLLVCGFIGFGIAWYGLYSRDKIWREYTLLHVIERLTGEKSTGYLIDEELREIIIERDDLQEKRFEEVVKNAEVVDLYKYMRPDKFNHLIAEKLSKKLGIKIDKLYKLLLKRERDSNIMIHPGVAIVSHMIKGRDKFEIMLVRSRMGIFLADGTDPIHAFFIIVASPDQKNFYLHALMWIIQISEDPELEKLWIEAKNDDELREIILKSWRKKERL
jgi:amino acid transporter/mannitol/fructose-specific phosphotransferase system IIA component (Ntr-type)